MTDDSVTSAPMKPIGHTAEGKPLFWAEPGRFTQPGVHVWDGEKHVLLWAYTAEGDAQGLPVAGYKPTQPQWAIDAVNQFKHLEERTLRAAESLEGAAVDHRLLAIGKTQLQGAFMFLARAVFQPGRISLPEDDQGKLDLNA